jgi:hypothetical protein
MAQERPVDCSSIGMDYLDPDAQVSCKLLAPTKPRWHGEIRVMTARGKGYSLVVEDMQAGEDSYVRTDDADNIVQNIGNHLFASASDIQNQYVQAGYTVSTLSGTLRSDPQVTVNCFIFDRFDGQPPSGILEGGPGYARSTVGIYCANDRDAAADRTVEQVLAQIQRPQ